MGKAKVKSLTNSRDFYPHPPNNEKLKFSGWIRPFWSSLYFFLQNNICFGWILDPGWPQPASLNGLIQPFLFFDFLKPSLRKVLLKYYLSATKRRLQLHIHNVSNALDSHYIELSLIQMSHSPTLKIPYDQNFCFPDVFSISARIFWILVSSPHTYGGTMTGRFVKLLIMLYINVNYAEN